MIEVVEEGAEQPFHARTGIVLVVLTKTVFEILGEPVTWAELAGFVTGIACVALAVAQRIETFPIGIANNVFFIVLFADARLYADMALQVVYIVLGVMGWWVWWKGTRDAAARSRAHRWRLLAATTVAVIAATLILVPILRAAHGAAPGWDALTTSMSLGAQLLLNLKRLETWYVWIAVDVIYVPLYFSPRPEPDRARLRRVPRALHPGVAPVARGHGLVLGKFLPPHAGHHELVDFALGRCSRVTVLVLGAVTERIPLALRRDWMRARHPAARVVAGWDELPVDFDDPLVHDAHIELMERLLNEPIDAVFTGEAYGDLLAARWGVEHVLHPRDGVISGTAVRADPAAWWSSLTPGVRA